MACRALATAWLVAAVTTTLSAQGTRLLRQPTLSATQVAFTDGSDLWIADRRGGQARRLTSTAAVETDPHVSPDGKRISGSAPGWRTTAARSTNSPAGSWPSRTSSAPQGVLGPKVLLLNELAGSGGDYFPCAFRQQQVGPLIGARPWGGLVKSSVHYALIDGGALTAPDNAVFDPINNRWVAENEGVPPDIEVLIDAKSVAAGRDPQLERAVQETLRLVTAQGGRKVVPPPFPRP